MTVKSARFSGESLSASAIRALKMRQRFSISCVRVSLSKALKNCREVVDSRDSVECDRPRRSNAQFLCQCVKNCDAFCVVDSSCKEAEHSEWSDVLGSTCAIDHRQGDPCLE